MAGLVPAIHVFLAAIFEDVDARDKPGHDEERAKLTPRKIPSRCRPAGGCRNDRPRCRCRLALRARLSPPGRFIYALLFVRMPLSDAGTVSGSFPSLCTAAKIAAMYPYGPRPQMTAVEALDVIECRCSSS